MAYKGGVPVNSGFYPRNDFPIVDAKDVYVSEEQRLDAALEALKNSVNNKVDSEHNHDDRYYTSETLDAKFEGKANATHDHDDRYYTETEIDSKLDGKADVSHNHDDVYYTESEIDSKLNEKADASHNHDDVYYTETEIDSKLSTINTSITNITNGDVVVKEAEHATNADSASTATKATQDGSGNVIVDTYETKEDADAKFDEAKEYTDEKVKNLASTSYVDTHNVATDAHSDIRGLISELSKKVTDFLDVDDATTDQLSEVLTLIANNQGTLDSITSGKVNVTDIVDNLTTADAKKVLSANQGVALKALIDALQRAVDGKAADEHTHAISDVSELQNALDQLALDIAQAKIDAANQDTVVLIEAQTSATTYTDSAVSGKADKVHTHAIADISGLQEALDDISSIEEITESEINSLFV